MKRFLLLVLAVVGIVGCGPAWAADSPEQLIKQGDALDAEFKNSAALALYLEAEKAQPNNSDLLRRIAREYSLSMSDVAGNDSRKKLGEQSVEYARRAVAADPKNASAQLALAICYGRLAPYLDNKTKIAYSKLVKQHADNAVALDPGEDYAYHVLGAWNYEMANLNGFLRAVVKLVYGALPDASNETAVTFFKKAIALAPQRVAHHIELGRTYVAMGRSDLARESLQKGLSLPNREKDDADTKRRGHEALARL